jgi:ferritin
MKFLVVLSAYLAVGFAEYCYNDVVSGCSARGVEVKNCHAKYGAVDALEFDLQSYANDHISRSFDYLLMSTHFGNYEQSREGFEKLFRKLSDSTWDDAIHLIKYITKRGGKMNFSARKLDEPQDNTSELYELGALARGLDTQKKLAEEAFDVHGRSTRRLEGHHDPEVSSYLEEHFLHRHAENIRQLSGYANDLKRLLSENKQSSLSLFLFDEYLQKVV